MIRTKNSKNPTNPSVPSPYAMKAITLPNFELSRWKIEPRNSEIKKCVRSTAAFHTTGPNLKEMSGILMSGLGGNRPSTGKDLANIYAMTKMMDIQAEKMASEKMTARQDARGTPPNSFSEDLPSLFL